MSDEESSEMSSDRIRAEMTDADCDETVLRLYAYLDGELTEERRRAISAHLDGCGECLDAVDFEAELRRVIADRCRDRVPDQLRERIALAIENALAEEG